MTQEEIRVVRSWIILSGLITCTVIAFGLLVTRSLSFIAITMFPTDLMKQGIAASIIIPIMMVLVKATYRGATDSPRTTVYFIVKAPLEEWLFRFNAILIIELLPVAFWPVAIVSTVVFAIKHGKHAIGALLNGIIFFSLFWFFGPVPAVAAHLTNNLYLRHLSRVEHGWYDED